MPTGGKTKYQVIKFVKPAHLPIHLVLIKCVFPQVLAGKAMAGTLPWW
jgi:hypothetical protein